VQRFFEDYKDLENKAVVVEGFHDRATAHAVIGESLALYKKLSTRLRAGEKV
jgi:inorganic pyrophosphatase